MPGKYGPLSPYGVAVYGSKPTYGEGVYASQVAAITNPLTGNSPFNLTPGSWFEARLFARAMVKALKYVEKDRALAQRDPARAFEGLPNLEDDYQTPPGPNDTIQQRQARVLAKKMGSRGASRANVVAVLRALLGSQLTAYVTRADTTAYPSVPANVFDATRWEVPAKWGVTAQPIAPPTGLPNLWVGYSNLIKTEPEMVLAINDVVMVGGENLDTYEGLLVLAVRGGPGAREFQAPFAFAHDKGCTLTTGRFYPQITNGRLQHIVLTAAAAADPATRALINAAMPDICRVVSLWAIIADNGAGTPTTPQFTLGPSGRPLGTAALGTVAYTKL